jgi:hypothetical protein
MTEQVTYNRERLVRAIFLILLFSSLVSLNGCGTADLRPRLIVEHGISDAKTAKARLIVAETLAEQDPRGRWPGFTRWEVTGVDQWHMTVFKRLTPVRDDAQRFELSMDLAGNAAVYTFLDGYKSGDQIGMDQEDVYRIVQGKKYENGGWRARLYFEPLYRAFLWPQTLLRMPLLVYGGQAELNGEFYYKIFASTDPGISDPGPNQYVIWINQLTRRVDLVEYTLRNVLKSYHGTAHYPEYVETEGVFIPARLRFSWKPGDRISHEVVIDRQTLR